MPVEAEEIFVKKDYSQTKLATLASMPIADSTIYTVKEFHIENVANRKSSSIRFELGLIGKVGTSIMLGDAMDNALESGSMVKTKIRPAGGIGIQFNAQLTKNDAIVFAGFPFSVSQQYFGGYTDAGRFYNKEIKLEYFDFTLGYQRTLFHYNDFGAIPSSMYARVDYGLGYLNRGEEYVNGELAETSTSYKKLNHNVGLSIGTTHKIKRFIVDYGISASVGLTSIVDETQTVSPISQQTNLMNVGGYVGVRYVL